MDTKILFQKAIKLEERGKYAEAVSVYLKITKKQKDPRFLIAYGVCLQKLGHWEQSVKKLEAGISLKPHYCEGDARLFLAESYLKLGKINMALKQWKIAEKMEPEYPSFEHVQEEAKKMLAKYG